MQTGFHTKALSSVLSTSKSDAVTLDKTNHIGYTPRPQVRRGHKANPLLSLRKLTLCAESFRRDRCGRCAAGSMRGVKPRPTGQDLPLPKDRQDNPGLIARRRTLSDAADAEPAMTCVTMSAQTAGSFHAAACQKPRQPASRCQSFVLSQVSALRLSRQGVRNRPPATRTRSRAPSLACQTAPHRSRDLQASHRRNRPH